MLRLLFFIQTRNIEQHSKVLGEMIGRVLLRINLYGPHLFSSRCPCYVFPNALCTISSPGTIHTMGSKSSILIATMLLVDAMNLGHWCQLVVAFVPGEELLSVLVGVEALLCVRGVALAKHQLVGLG